MAPQTQIADEIERGRLRDLFANDAVPPLLDVTRAPTDQATRRVAAAARELALADARLKRAEALCEQVRQRRNHLATKVLPELMDSAGQDRAGLPDMGCDVVVEPVCSAVIRADWPLDKREAAFAHLEALGAGDLVRATLVVEFAREDLPLARRLHEAVVKWLAQRRGAEPAVSLNMGVHWKTLTSWLANHLAREQEHDPHAAPRNTPAVDLETLGATVGRICRVVPRKKDKPVRVRQGQGGRRR